MAGGSQEGTLEAWVLVNYRYYGMPIEPPYVSGLIRLDGTDTNFLHIVDGFPSHDLDTVQATIGNGTRVKAVWEEERIGHILDIMCFAPSL